MAEASFKCEQILLSDREAKASYVAPSNNSEVGKYVHPRDGVGGQK